MTSPSPPISKITAFNVSPIEKSTNELLGYYVTSTASINVEDNPPRSETSVEVAIAEIAKYLVESHAPQIVVSIHGYATRRFDAKNRYQKIYNYATDICEPNTSVFLGYLWPSENPGNDSPETRTGQSSSFPEKLRYAFQSLPTLLIGILIATLVLGLVTAFLLVRQPYVSNPLVILPLIGVFSFFVTLGLLRLGKALTLLPNLPIWVLFLDWY